MLENMNNYKYRCIYIHIYSVRFINNKIVLTVKKIEISFYYILYFLSEVIEILLIPRNSITICKIALS